MKSGYKKNRDLNMVITFVLLTLITSLHCYSQGTEIDIAGRRPAWLEWSAGPVLNRYTVNVNPAVATPVTSNDMAIFSVLEAGYLFTKHFGLSTGLGLSSVAASLTLSSFNDKFNTKDSERESYERRIEGKDIIEMQKIAFLDIPLQLNLQGSLSNSIGFYIKSGVSISMPFKKSYNSTGTFTYTGYYPEYNVLIKDVAYEGFQSSVKNDVNGTLQLKSVNALFITSAGFQFLHQRRLQFSVGINYSRLVANPSDYDAVNTFHLSEFPGQMQSIMSGADDVTYGSIGLNIAFRYYL